MVVLLILFLFCVDSCCFLPYSLFSFSVLHVFSIVITSLGDERAGFHLFIYFARVNSCPSSLPLGVRD